MSRDTHGLPLPAYTVARRIVSLNGMMRQTGCLRFRWQTVTVRLTWFTSCTRGPPEAAHHRPTFSTSALVPLESRDFSLRLSLLPFFRRMRLERYQFFIKLRNYFTRPNYSQRLLFSNREYREISFLGLISCKIPTDLFFKRNFRKKRRKDLRECCFILSNFIPYPGKLFQIS